MRGAVDAARRAAHDREPGTRERFGKRLRNALAIAAETARADHRKALRIGDERAAIVEQCRRAEDFRENGRIIVIAERRHADAAALARFQNLRFVCFRAFLRLLHIAYELRWQAVLREGIRWRMKRCACRAEDCAELPRCRAADAVHAQERRKSQMLRLAFLFFHPQPLPSCSIWHPKF